MLSNVDVMFTCVYMVYIESERARESESERERARGREREREDCLKSLKIFNCAVNTS